MAYVKLINTDYVFNHTSVDKNTDHSLIEPNIIVAQDTSIQQIIGYNLLQTIMNMVAQNTINDPGNAQYLKLLNDFIQPALAHWTVYHALPDIQYRLTNKSILSKTTDNATTTGLSELKYLRENVAHYANFYNQRIREEIINNPQLYPEYFQSVGIDRIRPKRTTYFSGWSSNYDYGRKGSKNGHGDDSCCGEPYGIPLNW